MRHPGWIAREADGPRRRRRRTRADVVACSLPPVTPIAPIMSLDGKGLWRASKKGDVDAVQGHLDDDGDPEDYEQLSYYDSSLESLESAINDYLENDGTMEDLINSLPA